MRLEFLCAFRTAFFSSFIEKNIQVGFIGSDLLPYNPERVLFKLDVVLRTPTPPETLPEIRQPLGFKDTTECVRGQRTV
jgi:hypothetical protein